MLTELAVYVLSLMLAGFAPGRSPYSLEPVNCSADPNLKCAAVPVCPEGNARCANPAPRDPACCPEAFWESCYFGWKQTFEPKEGEPPRAPVCHPYRSEPGAWVRHETRAAGVVRFEGVAQPLADVAEDIGAVWPQGSRDFARVLVAQIGWSTGFREDIQAGRARGPGGEVCLADVQLPTLRRFVDAELTELPAEELVQRVIGSGATELRTCLEVVARGMLNAHKAAGWMCKGIGAPRLQSAFAIYHMGDQCTSAGLGWSWSPEAKRYGTVIKYRARGEIAFLPDWYRPTGGAS